MIAGASLTTGGILFQAILRNPLADPFILGISSGAAFGRMSAILLGPAIQQFFIFAGGYIIFNQDLFEFGFDDGIALFYSDLQP